MSDLLCSMKGMFSPNPKTPPNTSYGYSWNSTTERGGDLLTHINVQGEPIFSVMVGGWFCEKSG